MNHLSEHVEYSTMSEVDKKLYRYFGVYEEGEQEIKIIEPNITDVIQHFMRRFAIYRAEYVTSVDGGTGGTITFQDLFIPDIATEYTTEYLHDKSLMRQYGDTKQFIVGIAESVFGYGFKQEN